jgi:hypothetical protein
MTVSCPFHRFLLFEELASTSKLAPASVVLSKTLAQRQESRMPMARSRRVTTAL